MASTYFDTVVSTQFSDAVVRIGVADFTGPAQDGKRPTGEVTYLATSLPGLLQLQGQVQQLIDGLIERKVLKRQDAKSDPPKVG